MTFVTWTRSASTSATAVPPRSTTSARTYRSSCTPFEGPGRASNPIKWVPTGGVILPSATPATHPLSARPNRAACPVNKHKNSRISTRRICSSLHRQVAQALLPAQFALY